MILKINREITTEEGKVFLQFLGLDGICFNEISEAIDAMDEGDNDIELYMNSLGGVCSEGFAIYDCLRNSGKNVKAVIQGNCASMASVIMLAASERKAFQHATIHIHEPSVCVGEANRYDLQKLHSEISAISNQILDIYAERTGSERDRLEAIMKEDRDMKMDEAIELGFVQEIMPAASASAYEHKFTNPKNQTMSKKSITAKAAQGFLHALGLTAKDLEAKDYVLETEEGTDINVDIPEGEDPKVGDQASPDGTFTLMDGRVITIEDGVITEIKEAEEQNPDQEEMEALKAENEELKKKLEEVNAKAKSAEDDKVLAFVEKAGGIEKLAKLQSTFAPENRVPETKASEHEGETMLQKALREKREAVKNKKV